MSGHIDDPVIFVETPDGVEMDGITYESKTSAFAVGLLGLCGCGDDENVARVTGDFLRCVAIGKVYAYEYFRQFGIDTDKSDVARALVDTFLGALDRADITEHGTSGRCPWLTGKGESLYEQMGWEKR